MTQPQDVATAPPDRSGPGWGPLVVLSIAQFVMVLDQSVMNVSISQLVEDFDTSVTVIQGVITLYSLVMATLMLTGGKVGDLLGRRRAFVIGLAIYAVGSALTAGAWSVGALVAGWSVLEGIGAALVLPALVALIATTYEGPARVAAFGVIGGVSGAGIAAGPIIGGWFTTELSWRWVFVGEVVLVLVILATSRLLPADRRDRVVPSLDWVGSILTVVGLGMVVLGVLQAGEWGWLAPRSSPLTPFGFSLTPFVVGGGFAVLAGFVRWERHRTARGRDPLVDLSLFSVAPLRAGLMTMLSMNTILLGVFFTLPLYLQVVLGFDALDTGIRMLPISVAMFVLSASGPRLVRRFSPRTIVRVGFVALSLAVAIMMGTIETDLRGFVFGVGLTLLGAGMGLIASQVGNVIQGSVGPERRSEAGGLQFTAQQLGSSLGTALIGTVLVAALASASINLVNADDRVEDGLAERFSVAVTGNATFVPDEQVNEALLAAGVDEASAGAITENYSAAQLTALKAGLLLALAIALGSLMVTGRLPDRPLRPDDPTADVPPPTIPDLAGGASRA